MAHAVVILAVVAVSACSSLPYRTSVPRSVQWELEEYRNPDGTYRPGRPQFYSYCYSELFNTPKELTDEAKRDCPDGALTLHDRDYFWTSCSVQQPQRATFTCTSRQQSGDNASSAE